MRNFLVCSMLFLTTYHASFGQAYKYIGECYWEGLGVLKDKDIARKYFRKSKEYGFDIDEDYL